MKMKRRYREKNASVTVASQKGERIHDFLKGWGTVCKDGSILWDTWRPPTKAYSKKHKPRNFDKFTFPVVRNMDTGSITEVLLSVQPMQTYYGNK